MSLYVVNYFVPHTGALRKMSQVSLFTDTLHLSPSPSVLGANHSSMSV